MSTTNRYSVCCENSVKGKGIVAEKEKKTKSETANNVSLGTNAKMLGRSSDAGKQFKVAYDGKDNETGQKLHQGLKQISEYQETSIDKFGNKIDNTQTQHGYSAEVLDTAKQNAENIKRGSKERVVRTDDLGRVNDPKADQVTLDEHGQIISGSEVQMKFLKNADTTFKHLKSSKYQDKYPDGTFKIPADQYDSVKEKLKNEIERLEEKVPTPAEQEKLEYLKKVNENLKKSKVTKSEAIEARKKPKTVIAKQIARNSHEAGIDAAKVGVAVGGAISLIKNTIAVLRGEKEPHKAAIDTAGDATKAGLISYGTAFCNTALASVMKNSKAVCVRSLGKANAPAYIVQTAVSTIKSLMSLCKAEITLNEFFLEIGKNGTSLLAATKGAVIGQLLIPVPVLGALVGSLVSTLLWGAIYDCTIGMKALHAEIDAFSNQLAVEMIMLKEYQSRLMQLDIDKFRHETSTYGVVADYLQGDYSTQDFNTMLTLTYRYIGIPCPWGNSCFNDFMNDQSKVLTFG